jgi:hypothetical protein
MGGEFKGSPPHTRAPGGSYWHAAFSLPALRKGRAAFRGLARFAAVCGMSSLVAGISVQVVSALMPKSEGTFVWEVVTMGVSGCGGLVAYGLTYFLLSQLRLVGARSTSRVEER